jgi:hypothetical protein
LRRSLAEDTVHDACRLCLLEGRLLLETSLLWERRLLLETGGLGSKAVRHTGGSRLELLARRVCERRAGLLALVQSLLVAYTHSLRAELGLSELGLRLETGRLGLHVLLWHLRHLGDHAILLREAAVSSRLRLLHLLILLLHLEFL